MAKKNQYGLTKKEVDHQRMIILAAMKMLGVNQSEFARALGVGRSFVSRWMTGSAKISPIQAIKISKLVPDITIEQMCPDIYDDISYPEKKTKIY